MQWKQHARTLAEQLTNEGHLRSAEWRRALLAIPRHRFVHASLEEAWEDRVIVTHRSPDGAVLSSLSQPTVVFAMLELLAPQHGSRVLEVGTGTGYNAALLAHRCGAENVYSIDVDAECVAEARENLDAVGYSDVQLRVADGALGVQEWAPFDRIIATCEMESIPEAWHAQLIPGGRIVAPVSDSDIPGALVVEEKDRWGQMHRRIARMRVMFIPERRAS